MAEKIPLLSWNQAGHGVYHIALSLDDTGQTPGYMLPICPSADIAVNISGTNAILELTNDTEEEIDAGTAEWNAWDTQEVINPAIMGVRLVSTGGAADVTISIRTFGIGSGL